MQPPADAGLAPSAHAQPMAHRFRRHGTMASIGFGQLGQGWQRRRSPPGRPSRLAALHPICPCDSRAPRSKSSDTGAASVRTINTSSSPVKCISFARCAPRQRGAARPSHGYESTSRRRDGASPSLPTRNLVFARCCRAGRKPSSVLFRLDPD